MFDLLIKNGLVVDGSGLPAYEGDVGIAGGKIIELGRLGSKAARVIDAKGKVVAPGFVDNHCHYDAQVTWDPLCSFSCYHGVTTVVTGNCSLTLAPVRLGDRSRLAGMLSYVEGIPVEVLDAGVPWNWESFPEYMQAIGGRRGVNVAPLIGHTAIRLFAMGDAAQERAATAEELAVMKQVLRDAMNAGAIGLSITRNRTHFDMDGKSIPGACAPDAELFELCNVLGELGTGVIQCGGGTELELKERLLSRISQASGRRVLYNALMEQARAPGQWRKHLAHAEAVAREGIRAIPLCCPNAITERFDMRICQAFDTLPTWNPVLRAESAEKLRAYADPEFRRKVRAELDQPIGLKSSFSGRWDLVEIDAPYLEKNRHLKGKTIADLAAAGGKHPLDVFLDLVVEEELRTEFVMSQFNTDNEAMAAILSSPYAVIGLSDGGAHAQMISTASVSTRLLGHWVRKQKIMSLEMAVRRLTYESAIAFGIYDRGLLQPGMAADVVIFDPDTVGPGKLDKVHDLPGNNWRLRELAEGILYTVVNGEVLLEHGEHAGAYPGKILRNALYGRAG